LTSRSDLLFYIERYPDCGHVKTALPVTFATNGNGLLVLNTAKIGWELIEKRGEIYSSRPSFITAYVLSILYL
jgi:hypothetical protein